MLRQQKERLKMTSNQLKTPEGNQSTVQQLEVEHEDDRASITSGVVQLAALTASNRENFNYLQGMVPGQERVGVVERIRRAEEEVVKEVQLEEEGDVKEHLI